MTFGVRSPAVRSLSWAAAVILAAAACAGKAPLPAAADDLLILRDGGQLRGAFMGCVDERCTINGVPIPRTQIAWIGLHDAGPSPPETGGRPAQDGLWLADGSSLKGIFEGTAPGKINFSGKVVDRDAVRWIHLSAPGLAGDSGGGPIESDVLIRRDGAFKLGDLQGCSAASCTMAGAATPREELAWIGLGVDPETPPPAAPPEADIDAVGLADGALHTAPLLGINAATVVTQRGSHPRSEVEWIYLAPPRRDTDSPPIYRPSPPPPSEPGAPPPSPPPPPTPPVPPPSAGAPSPPSAGQGERGGLWTGTMVGRTFGTVDGIYSEFNSTIAVKMREYRFPLNCYNPDLRTLERVGTFIRLEPEGSVVENRFHCRGPDLSCDGSGSVTVTVGPEENGIGHASSIYLKTAARDTTACLGFNVPTPGTYIISVPTRNEDCFPVIYTSSTGTSTVESSFLILLAGWSSILPISECVDREVRTLEGDGGIMRGSYTGLCTGCCPQMEASWSICREGADCPPPPRLPDPSAPPAEPDPCPKPNIQQGLLDVALRQQKLLSDHLVGRMDEYFALSGQAAQYRSDYEQAARDCGLWSVAITLTGFLVSNPGANVGNLPTLLPGGLPAQGAKALEQFYNFLSFVDKVSSNDASWLLPDQSFKDFAKIPNGYGGFLDAEGIYDGLGAALDFLESQAGMASPDSMLQDLRSCGAPTAQVIMDDAIHYLRLLEQIQPIMRDAQRTLNDLEDKDEEIFNLWSQYRLACLEHVRCTGGDPSDCDQMPAAGHSTAP